MSQSNSWAFKVLNLAANANPIDAIKTYKEKSKHACIVDLVLHLASVQLKRKSVKCIKRLAIMP